MDIIWLGHACFRLRAGDTAVVTDPYPEGLGLPIGRPQARIVTVSYRHPNHSHTASVAGDPYVVPGPGEYELQGVHVRGLRTPPGPNDPPDKRNTAYVIDMDGVMVCHLGDLGRPLPQSLIEELGTVNVLLVPAGGTCTLSAREAAEVVSAVAPRLVIPMHYALPGLRVELGSLEPFLKELGIKPAEPQPRLQVTPNNLPAEMRVVLLEPQGLRAA